MQTEFPLRHRELQSLLEEADKALRRCGLALRRHGSHDGPREMTEVGPTLGPDLNESQASEQRGRVREVATALLSQLGARLYTLSSTFARLSEEERAALATLLQLSDEARGVIASLLRLSEQERKELSIAFRLSETECGALADLLVPGSRPTGETAPTITIVDPEFGDEPPGGRASEPDAA